MIEIEPTPGVRREDRMGVSGTESVAGLRDLFTEVNALAIQLRKGDEEGHAMEAAGLGILRILQQDGPLTVPEIARIRATSRQNIQILVNRLVAGGLLEVTNNPAHKRSALLQLTDRGRKLGTAAADEEAKSLAKLWQGVSEAEVRTAAGALHQLRTMLAGRRSWSSEPVRATSEAERDRNERSVQKEQLPAREATGDDFPVNLL